MANSEDGSRKPRLKAALKNPSPSPCPTSLEDEIVCLNNMLKGISLCFNSNENKTLEKYEGQETDTVVYDGGFDLFK